MYIMRNQDWPFQYFTREEFAGPPQADLVRRLDKARDVAGIPFVLTSAFRSGDDGSHGRGYGVDIRCWTSRNRFLLLHSLVMAGFRRIGIYDRHIHVDCDPFLPPRVVWLGKSR